MTRTEKQEIMEMPTVAVYSMGLAGLEIKKIEYGIEDYIVFVAPGGTVHKRKVYYTAPSGQPYFRFGNITVCTNECILV